MARIDLKDVIGGAVFGAVGLFFFVKALGYGIGTPRNMGSGFVPMSLGLAAMIIAVFIVVPALRREGVQPQIAWRPLVAVAASIAGFALTCRWLGYVPATALVVLFAAAGSRENSALKTIALAAAAAAGIWLVFGLGLRIPTPPIRGLS